MEDIVYIVADPLLIAQSNNEFFFTDIACNSAQTPEYSNNINVSDVSVPKIYWFGSCGD